MSIGNYTINPITDADRDWIDSRIIELSEYLEKKTGTKYTATPDPGTLDRYIDIAWDDMEDDDIINLFGCGFGNYFVKEAGFEWVLFSDEYGSDLAVHNRETGVSGFPLSSAAKRLKDPDAGRFDAIFASLTKA